MRDEKSTKLSESVLEKIEEKKIRPEPKWKFLLRDYFVWSFGIFSVLIGAAAFSVILYMLRASDWGLYENIDNNFFSFLIGSLPYFWIGILLVFIFAADYNFKHTKSGYKYKTYAVVLASIFISVISGALLFNIGAGRAIDNAFAERVPLYKHAVNKMHKQRMMWDRPQEGFLSGVIVSMRDKRNFEINDLNDLLWLIDGGGAELIHEKDIVLGRGVRIFGKIIDDKISPKEFEAFKILPMPEKSWMKCGQPPHPPLHKINKNECDYDCDNEKRKTENLHKPCQSDSECELPFSYAIKSNCPYEAKCQNENCEVICPLSKNSQEE